MKHELDINSQNLYIFITNRNSILIFLDSLFSSLSIVCIARSVFKHPFKAKYIILHLTKCHLLYYKRSMYELWIRKEICVIKAVYFLHTCNILEKSFYMRHQMMTNFHVVFKRQMEFLDIIWSLHVKAFKIPQKPLSFQPLMLLKLTWQFIFTNPLMMINHKKQIK